MASFQYLSKSDWKEKINIRNFKNIEDLSFAVQLTTGEKWHAETEAELKTLYENDPEGCFIAEVSGEPAGICIATGYTQVGFIGDLIVSPIKRGNGHWKKLNGKRNKLFKF